MPKTFIVPFPKFSLGEVYATDEAYEAIAAEDITKALYRHQDGDWGDVSEEDINQNDFTLLTGGYRLVSEYHDRNGVKFRIVTARDRSTTTVELLGQMKTE